MGHRKDKPPQGKEFSSPISFLKKMEDNNCCLPSVKGVGPPIYRGRGIYLHSPLRSTGVKKGG